MINVKKMLTKILSAIGNKVDKTGDTMSGNLVATKADDACYFKVNASQSGSVVTGGGMWATVGGSFGLYDDVNRRWLIRSDNRGTHVPATLATISSAKTTCSRVSTSYTYKAVAGMENWNVIAIRFVVHEQIQLLICVRGESFERSLTDWPSAGKFRGGIYVDWANNRIGMRCLNAGSNNTRVDLVYYDRVYGVF